MHSIRTTVATLLVGALTYAGAAVPSYAADPDPASPVLPEVAEELSQSPEEVLETAQEVLTGEADEEHATTALVDLVQVLPELDGEDRTAAQRILARPDGTGGGFVGQPLYGFVQKFAACGDHVCVHFVKNGQHAVNPADANGLADGDGVPDWVESNLAVLEGSWQAEVVSLGFYPPRPDGDLGENVNVLVGSADGKIDVYLAQLQAGLFGYALPEADANDGNARTRTGHLVLDADFGGFTCTPDVCLRATASHELFHLIQFRYDFLEADWIMESTATWAEERAYDWANDNRNYLQFSSLRRASQPLDTADGRAEYGNWIFWEYLTRRKGVGFVRNLWWHAGAAGVDDRAAVTRALSAHSLSLPSTFADFSAVSNAPRSFYEEGAAYPSAEISGFHRLTRSARSTGWRNATLDHLGARNYAVSPASGLTATDWRLTVNVNGPSGSATTAYAVVHYRNGSTWRVPITLNGYGDGSRRFDFSYNRVVKVTVSLGNAGTADSRVTSFRATAHRI